jgi:outer membrane cobalamin receptor
MLTSRKKHLPSSEYDTIFGDPRLTFEDTRGLVEARWEPKLGDSLQSLSRAHVDMYDFSGVQPYYDADGGVAHEEYRGRWAGIEQRFLYTPSDRVRVTVGGTLQRHFTVTMTGKQDIAGTYLDSSTPYGVAAAYAVADASITERARASAGVRIDSFSTFGASVNPRGALIFKPYDGGILKLMAGKAFRAPSPYELHYQSLTQSPSPSLRPEQVLSGEVELTHRFSPLTSVVVAGFSNYVSDIITSRGSGSPNDPTHLVNASEPVLAVGGEVEARREMQGGWMLSASASVQRLLYLHNDEQLRNVPNSPFVLGAVKAAVPLIGRSLSAMTRLSIEGPRWDRHELPTDPAQGHTAGAAIWDIVLSGEVEGYGVFYALGVYNAFDASYSAPVSTEYRHVTIPQNGRTALLSTSVRF